MSRIVGAQKSTSAKNSAAKSCTAKEAASSGGVVSGRASRTGGAFGRSTVPAERDLQHGGWAADPAHYNAPAGGGGPGGFSKANPLDDSRKSNAKPQEGANLLHPQVPGPMQATPTQAPAPPNAPPATHPHSLGSLLSVQSSLVNISIDAEVLADGSKRGSTETRFNLPRYSVPGYQTDPRSGNITSFDGQFEWRGTITIQTRYGGNETATDLSCYGRGTTVSDVRNRDVTLGFHENRHQLDYVNYLRNHALPNPPQMSVGMARTVFEAEVSRFEQEYRDYKDNMSDHSEARTDEVGHRRSTYVQTNQCFVH